MDRLRRMEIFVKLAEVGQFTRASKQLSVSKSTVSKAVSDLEAYLGLQLVKRDGRSFQLTEAGHTYYEECAQVLANINALEDQVRGDTLGMSGPIRITSTTAYGNKTITPLILKFMKLYPEISIDMILTERSVDLVAEDIDLAFRVGVMKDSDHLARKIGSTQLMLCAAPSYLKTHGEPKTVFDLEDHNCLIYATSPPWLFTVDGEPYRFDPKGNVQTNNGDNLREFILSGLGIGFIPEYWIADDLINGRLVELIQDIRGVTLNLNIVRPAGRHCPARVETFIDFLLAELQAE